MLSTDLAHEFRRKVFHLVGLLIPICYWFLTQYQALVILGIICVIYYMVEILRKVSTPFHDWHLKTLKPLLRESEYNTVAGTTHFITGCWLTAFIFSKPIAIISITMFIWGDLAAAIVGKIFGKHKIIFNKSWEGCFGCLLIAILVGVLCKITLFPTISLPVICIAALIGTILELISKGNLDNFTLPLGMGLVYWYFSV